MTNPRYKYKNKANVKFEVKHIGKPFVTNCQPTYFEKHYRENLDYDCYTDKVSKTGKILYGQAGCGKTTQLCQLIYENAQNALLLSHTNKAVVNIKNSLKKSYKMSPEDINRICHTFESYFFDNIRSIDNLKDKMVFVDEYTMTPNRFIALSYQAYTKYDITIIMSGDVNQCEPINNVKSRRHNYLESQSVYEMSSIRVEMKYIEGSARYDQQTRCMLGNFLTYKHLKHKFEPIGQYYKNICWLNDTRRRVTKECCDRFVKDKQSCEINFKYKSQIEKYRVCVGMPVICTQNMKPKNMFNMMEFTIDKIFDGDISGFVFIDDKEYEKITNLKIEINNEIFDKNEFSANFLPNFCNTVYKSQGGKIDEHYNTWDTHKMDVKEMYTSLSRTTKLEYIHLDNKKKCRWYGEREQAEMIIVNSYFNADYQNGKIYQITFENNDKIYVGCTTQLLEDRLDEHYLKQKSAVYKYRDDNRKIDLICLCPCKDKKTLEKIDNSYINEYKQKYGDNLLNIKGVKKVKKIKNEFTVEIENQKQFEERLEKMGYKLRIKDDTIRSYLEIDAVINCKRIKHKRRYNENNKQEAFEKLSEILNKN